MQKAIQLLLCIFRKAYLFFLLNLFLKTNTPPKSPINAAPILRSVLVLSPVLGSKLDIPSCPAGVLESPDESSGTVTVIESVLQLSISYLKHPAPTTTPMSHHLAPTNAPPDSGAALSL